jgi:sugar-phosphatase
VLIDSTPCIIRHWERWAQRHGLDITDVMQVAHGYRTDETMRIVAPHLDANAEAERFRAAEVLDTDGVKAIEGAAGLLAPLPGDAWAIVTSASRDLALVRLQHAGVPLPDALVCGDDVTHGKPSPEPYLLGASRLGIPPERCIAVEDAPAGIASARAAGMRVIGVASTHRREELDCTAIVDRLAALQIEVQDGATDRLIVRLEGGSV